MANPFDDENGKFFVLVNDEGQHCIWPVFAAAPGGWTIIHGEDSKAASLAYVEENWADMRPKSLALAPAA